MKVEPRAGNRVRIFHEDENEPMYLDVYTVPGSDSAFEVIIKKMTEHDGKLIPTDSDVSVRRVVIKGEGY